MLKIVISVDPIVPMVIIKTTCEMAMMSPPVKLVEAKIPNLSIKTARLRIFMSKTLSETMLSITYNAAILKNVISAVGMIHVEGGTKKYSGILTSILINNNHILHLNYLI